METARTRQAEAGILLSSPLVYGRLKDIGELAYGPNMEDEFRRCAGYVSRILNGAKPSELLRLITRSNFSGRWIGRLPKR
jgi:hypothetical protein